jgi:hypothetical protein
MFIRFENVHTNLNAIVRRDFLFRKHMYMFRRPGKN